MKDYYFTCFDLETGGFKPDKHAITEGAFIVYHAGTLREEYRYSSLVKPYAGLGYDDEALESTGITMEMIEEKGVTIQEWVENVVKCFKKGFGGGKGRWARKTILVGHNIDDFDIPFLSTAFEVVGVDILDHVSETTEDTLWMARKKWMNEGGKFNLGACCRRAGIDLVDAHRAAQDAEATMKLHKFFVNCLRSNNAMAQAEKKSTFREKFRF